eukprot:Pgem_evm1s17130
MEAIETLNPEVYHKYQKAYKNTICGRHPIAVLINIDDLSNKICNVDCVVSEWASWSGCNAVCTSGNEQAIGKQKRSREVITPNQNGGVPCPSTNQSEECTIPCPIDCELSSWIQGEECNGDCKNSNSAGIATGNKTFYRDVLVKPINGGAECGVTNKTEPCSIECDVVNCVVGDWSNWSKCDVVACAPGDKESTGEHTRERGIDTPNQNGGAPCPPTQESKNCTLPCPVDCELSGWIPDEPCNADCANSNPEGIGMGEKTFYKRILVNASNGGQECGKTQLTEPCRIECDIDCVYNEWEIVESCNADCNEANGSGNATGVEKYNRTVLINATNDGSSCDKKEMENPCVIQCPIDCVVSSWTEWSDCDGECSVDIVQNATTGYHYRIREVTTPSKNGGEACPKLSDQKACTIPCVVDCVMSNWIVSEPCQSNCSNANENGEVEGEITYTRTILTNPENNGTSCGPLEKKEVCQEQCPIDCVLSAWQDGGCNAFCNFANESGIATGEQTYYRDVLVKPLNGGKECELPLTKQETCFIECPVGCIVGEWNDQGSCSAICDGTSAEATGTQNQVRVNIPSNNGAADCPESSQKTPCSIPCEVCKYPEVVNNCTASCENLTTITTETQINGTITTFYTYPDGSINGLDYPDYCILPQNVTKPCSTTCSPPPSSVQGGDNNDNTNVAAIAGGSAAAAVVVVAGIVLAVKFLPAAVGSAPVATANTANVAATTENPLFAESGLTFENPMFEPPATNL